MDFVSEYGGDLALLGLYVAGIAAYTLAVTMLYVPMGTRLMFARRFGERAVATPGRRFLYVLLFPLVSFGFFLLVASALVIFSDENISGGAAALATKDILLISMGLVLAIRICAYFHEDGAKELAKVMPLGLLGVVLVTNRLQEAAGALSNLQNLATHLDLIAVFFVGVVVTEFLLRTLVEVFRRPAPRKEAVTFQRRT